MTNHNESVFNSQQVSQLTVAEVKRRKYAPRAGIATGIPGLDNDLLPLRPGELVPVLGNTSNYKSGVMMFIARHAVEQIRDEPNAVILYATWEQSTEEQGMIEIANTSSIDASKLARGDLSQSEWTDMMKAAVDRALTPLWHIGHSSQAGKRRPRLSMSDVARAMEYIVDKAGKSIALVCLDYAQRIRSETGRTRREQIMDIVDRAKDMALAFGCPVLLGTQAGRQVLERTWKMPQLQDAQETSNLEQSADKFLSVWMPKTSEPPGSTVGDPPMKVTDNLLYIQILKQKFGPAPCLYALHVKPESNEIFRMDTMYPKG